MNRETRQPVASDGARFGFERTTVTAVVLVVLMVGAALAPPAVASGATTVGEGNSTPAAESVEAAATANVSGTVVGPDGTPLSGDGVSFFAEPNDTAFDQTTDTGEYSVSVTAGTTYEVQYYQTNGSGGLFPQDGVADVYAVENRSYTDGAVQNVSVPTGHQLDITVEDEAGNPIEGVNVDVIHRRNGATAGSPGTTDANGVWTPENATTPGIEVNGTVQVVGGLRSDAYETNGRELTVDADRSVTLTLSERTTDTVTLEGSVSYPDGSAAANDSLLLFNRTADDYRQATTDATGDFATSVLPNTTYRVAYWQAPVWQDPIAAFPRDGVADFAALGTVDSGTGTTAQFTVPAGNVLNATVEDVNGAALEGASVAVDTSVAGEPMGIYAYRQDRGLPTNADGRMTHPPNARPGLELSGATELRVDGPNASYGEDRAVLDVTGDTAETLTLDRRVAVNGTVTYPNGTAAANVTVWFVNGTAGEDFAATTDGNGAYSARVKPGVTYRIAYRQRSRGPDGGSTYPRDGVADIAGAGEITVTEDTVRDITVPTGDVLAVAVKDDAGNPIEGASVTVVETRGTPAVAQGTTDGDGVWTPEHGSQAGVEVDGEVEVFVEPPGGSNYLSNATTVTVDGPTEAAVTLDQGNQVSGQVTYPNGTGAANVTLALTTPEDRRWTTTNATGGYSVTARSGVTYEVKYWQGIVNPDPSVTTAFPRDGVADFAALGTVTTASDTTRDFSVPAGNVLDVTVENETGAPIEDARVKLVHEQLPQVSFNSYDAASEALVSFYEYRTEVGPTTDSQGRMTHVPNGQPGIEVANTGPIYATVSPPPGTDYVENRTSFAGVDSPTDVTVTLEQPTNITGSVVDANGDPVTDGTVFASQGPDAPNYEVQLDDSGAFNLSGVEPGTYAVGLVQDETIGVEKDGVPDLFFFGAFDASGSVTDLGEQPVPAASVVNVTVTDDAGEPVPGATVVVGHTSTDGVGDGIPIPANENGVLRAPNASTPGVELAGNVTVGATRPSNSTAYAPERKVVNTTLDGPRDFAFTVNRTAVSPRAVSFPETDIGNTTTETVTVTNNGDESLAVTDTVVESPAYTVVEGGGNFVLEPGQSRSVTVAFSPETTGTAEGALVFANPEPSNGEPLTVPLSGSGAGYTVTGALEANDSSPVANGTVILSGPDVPTYTTQLNDTGGYAVTDVEPGTYAASLLQNGTMGSPDGVPDFYITGPYYVSTDNTDLGTQSLPQAHVVDVTVEDEGGAPVENALVAVAHTPDSGIGDGIPFQTDANGTLEPFTLSDDFELNNVTLADAEPGNGIELAGNVTLGAEPPLNSTAYTPAPDLVSDTITGPASYTLTLNRTAVTPREVTFENTPTDDRVTETVTITNDGVAPLSVNDTVIEGSSAYTVVEGGAFTLEPGESRTVTVGFDPAETGTLNGTLVFENPEPSFGPALTVPLSRNGTVPTVNATGTLLDADGDPVTNGTVILAGPDVPTYTTQLNDNGEFTVDDVEEGTYAVSLLQNGTIGSPDGVPDFYITGPFNLTGDTDEVGVQQLPQAHVVDVTVADDTGAPVENALVAVAHTPDSGIGDGIPFQTDANGTLQPFTLTDDFDLPGVSLADAEPGNGIELAGNVTLGAEPPLNSTTYAPAADVVNDTVTGPSNYTLTLNRTPVSPGEVTFPGTATDSTATETVTVTNDGVVPLAVDGTTIEGSSAYTIVDGGEFTIEPGESRTVTVEFAPASTGTAEGTLVFENVDPSFGPPLTVALTGDGEQESGGGGGGVGGGGDDSADDDTDEPTDTTDEPTDDDTADDGNVTDDGNTTDGNTTDTNETDTGTPSISADQSSVDFGTTTVGNATAASVTVTNTGNATGTVTSVGTGGDAAFVTSAGSRTLDPGGSTSVRVRFDPSAPGTFDGQLVVNTDGPGGDTVGLTGTAEGVPAVAVEPTSIEFGNVRTGTEVRATVVVRNTGTGPLSVSETAEGDSGAFTLAEGTPDTLAASESARATVAFSADDAGEYDGAVAFDTNDTDRGTVSVSATATAVESDLGVEPGSLSFNDTVVGNATTLSVTVSNTGNASANLTGVDVAGDDGDAFAVVSGGGSGSLSAGESRTVTVEFAPGATGAKTAQLGIGTATGEDLNVPLSGTATRPELRVSRSSVDFGNVTLDERVTTTVTLSNRGSEPLRVGSAAVVGADPGSFGLVEPAAPLTLEPGEQRTATIEFQPTTPGSKSAILKLRTNDPQQPVTSVWLSNTNTRVEINATQENDTSQVAIDVNNASANSSVAVNVSTPESRDDRASVDEINVSVEEGGDFSLNVTSDDDELDTTGEFTPNETNNTAPVGYVNVSHSVADENISQVSFTFRVSKDSVESRNVSAGDVTLHRKVDGEWTELDTTLVGETETHYRYRGVSPGLSDFVAAVNQPQFELVEAAVSISEVRVGEAAGVEVTIDNTGKADGAFTANLLLDDTVVDRKTVTVAASSRRVLVFQQEIDEAGTYTVEVNNVTAGRVNVTDPGSDGTDGDGDDSGGGSDTGDAGDGGDGGSSMPLDGFGALPALVALVALAFAAMRRRGGG
ncbi:choice-of-anchor D domain-containing protein [Halostella salina]|uniref:choice-of-anchor D domain-containing protein n=1 Tax=Halostella salina TaxID=1547897 RepID=UPI0013CEE4EA|nr:choice-of-anchor D domain-containing protein [Halostella salina]